MRNVQYRGEKRLFVGYWSMILVGYHGPTPECQTPECQSAEQKEEMQKHIETLKELTKSAANKANAADARTSRS